MEDNCVTQSEIDSAMKQLESRGLQGGDELVTQLKYDAAVFLARINRISIPPDNREAGRLVALAKTDVECAVMWAVKAVSRG